MKKFLRSVFAPIYKEIAGIQLKYQSMTSNEIFLKNSMLNNEIELNHLDQVLGRMNKKLSDLDINSIQAKQEQSILTQRIEKIRDDKQYLKYRKDIFQYHMENLIKQKTKFENENPEVFRQFK